jgi:hypothetical protein
VIRWLRDLQIFHISDYRTAVFGGLQAAGGDAMPFRASAVHTFETGNSKLGITEQKFCTSTGHSPTMKIAAPGGGRGNKSDAKISSFNHVLVTLADLFFLSAILAHHQHFIPSR